MMFSLPFHKGLCAALLELLYTRPAGEAGKGSSVGGGEGLGPLPTWPRVQAFRLFPCHTTKGHRPVNQWLR